AWAQLRTANGRWEPSRLRAGTTALTQGPQGLHSPLDRLQPLREAEPEMTAAQRRVVVEAGRRHGRHRCSLDQMAREQGVVVEPPPADAGHHVVRAAWGRRLEAAFDESGDDRVPPLEIVSAELDIKGRGKLERRRHRNLQWVGGSDGEEVVDLTDAGGQRCRSDEDR